MAPDGGNMSKILIKNGKVWSGESFSFSDVLINDSKIIKIAENISEDAPFVYDAEGKIVSPGLVDIHVHMKGISPDAYGINAEMSSFPFGVVAVADAGALKGDKRFLEDLAVKNCVFLATGIDNNNAMLSHAEKMLGIYEDKAIGVKICIDAEQCKVYDLNPLLQVLEFAEKHGLIVMVHSTGSPVKMAEIVKTLRKGDILSHAYHGGINNSMDDDFECIFEGKSRGVIIDAGMAGGVHTDFNVLKEAIKKGAAPDTISTDITYHSAYKRGGRYGMTMCMSILKDMGMSEGGIFKAVTRKPARVLGKENMWGSLKEGKNADVAVFDYTDEGYNITDRAGNIISGKRGYRCTLTIADGEVLFKY